MKINKLMVTKNTQGICYCSTGKKTKKITIKACNENVGVRYCEYCKTAYINQNNYENTSIIGYKLFDDVDKNEKIIQEMMKKSKILVSNRKEALREKHIEYKKAEKLVRDKEIEKAKVLEEHKKKHEGQIEIYSHNMENHYSEPYVHKNPKNKGKRTFFS